MSIGLRSWAIAEGYIPEYSVSGERPLISHETFCVLNTGAAEADIIVVICFADRDPAGPYRFAVPGNRTRHFRVNDFCDLEPVPRGTDFAAVIEASVPVVVQHTRLVSRDPHISLRSTIAFPDAPQSF